MPPGRTFARRLDVGVKTLLQGLAAGIHAGAGQGSALIGRNGRAGRDEEQRAERDGGEDDRAGGLAGREFAGARHGIAARAGSWSGRGLGATSRKSDRHLELGCRRRMRGASRRRMLGGVWPFDPGRSAFCPLGLKGSGDPVGPRGEPPPDDLPADRPDWGDRPNTKNGRLGRFFRAGQRVWRQPPPRGHWRFFEAWPTQPEWEVNRQP